MGGVGVGVVERRVLATGRRFGTVLRAVVLVALGLVAALDAPSPLPVIALVIGWSVVVFRCADRWWAVPADVAVVCALCLGQTALVRPDVLTGSANWVVAVASITAVTLQWRVDLLGGVLLVGAIVVCEIAGGGVAMAPIALWTFAEAGMSRGLMFLLLKGARSADRGAAAAERAHRVARVAAARRADEREHWAVLHDTAAATLFVAGSGAVRGREPWLADRAARDIATLTAGVPGGSRDLVPLLSDIAAASPLDVEFHAPSSVPLDASAAEALSRAAGEALANTARHAGVDRAVLRVAVEGPTVAVEVVDRGRGFDADSVSLPRRGVRQSIVDRVRSAGGRAVVRSGAGGTVVRLEWPGG
uniref:sensor histidine kinase n=1 Tax=Saccharothrix mutabilis TaxID=33921 RepID=UPI0031D4F237